MGTCQWYNVRDKTNVQRLTKTTTNGHVGGRVVRDISAKENGIIAHFTRHRVGVHGDVLCATLCRHILVCIYRAQRGRFLAVVDGRQTRQVESRNARGRQPQQQQPHDARRGVHFRMWIVHKVRVPVPCAKCASSGQQRRWQYDLR